MKLSNKISFATFCSDILGESISDSWIVAFKAFDNLPLTKSEFEIWRAMSGRDEYVARDYGEMVVCKGRRAQGSKTATKYLAYKIHTENYRRYASRNDRLHCPIIAQNRDISKEIMSYLSDFYTNSDLRTEAGEILKGSIELKNNFVISVQTCSYRAFRGLNIPLSFCDELGTWRIEGSQVDEEVVRSLTPAQIQFPNRKLILMGSPWVKAGILHDRFQKRFEDTERLILHCPTALMNPSIPAAELAREEKADSQNYRREFLAEWLDSEDQFLPDADIDAAVFKGIREQPFVEALKSQYVACADASGLGGSGDRFTFAIGHRTMRGSNGGCSLDVIRGWQRRGVAEVIDELAATLRAYSLSHIYLDQYSFPYLKELCAQRGLTATQLAWSARNKPEIFLDLKTSLAQGSLKLLDYHPEVLRELRSLVARRTSGGHTTISGQNSHDDYACVLAMLNYECKKSQDGGICFLAVAPQHTFNR